MVNDPIQPTNPNSSINKASSQEHIQKTPGGFNFTTGQVFLGMKFTADEWNKLMNIMLKNLGNYINKTMNKMKEKMKKDWKRGEGEDVD
jgi:hypothetical protein